MKTPSNHQKLTRNGRIEPKKATLPFKITNFRQKLVKNGKNQPKLTNFRQISPKNTIFHAQKSNLCKKSPKIHQIEQKVCSIFAKNREKCHFLAKFTVFPGKLTPKITFLHGFNAKFDQKIDFLRIFVCNFAQETAFLCVFTAKLPKFSKSLLRLGPKLGQNVIRKSKTLLRFAYFPRNKRDFSADAVPLSSALRPRLFGVVLVATLSIILQICYTSPTFATSITLSIPKSLSLDITPTSTTTYKKSTSSEIKVSTDAPFGYELSIKSKDSVNKNTLMNDNNKLPSITTAISESTYQASGNTNTWGYIPSKFNSSASTDVRPGPTDTGDSLDKTSIANASTDNTYTIALATKIDNTLPAGTYKNTFIISASANSVNYSVTYNLNSGTNGPSNIPNTSTTNNTITLENKTPTRSGYEFLGWCDKSTSTESCSGQTYQPGQTYTLTSSANAINLYAMWKQSTLPMQNWKGCSSLAEHEIVSLEDTRDSTIYKVSKLKDGKCWMIDDLKIANKTITSSNSDVSSSFTLPSSSTSGFSDFDVANVYIDPIYGGYYTWYAATAGEGKYNMTKGDSSHSICPKGWRLPTGGTGSEFETLENLYDDNPLATPVPGFKLGGLYFYSKPLYVGDQGGYWSSTASDRYSAYVIQVSSSGLGYKVVGDKPSGGPMRCVARE